LVEQNGVPGAVNRIAARWALAVATAFDAAAARLPDDVRVERTGNPVRAEILEVPEHRTSLRREASTTFGLDAARRTVGVFGGSQGALHLDEAVAAAVPHLKHRSDVQLLVSAGADHVDVVEAARHDAGDLLIRVVGSIERMDLALAATDLAVSRSGSGHVTELAICGVPAILVPYPHATENHQEANARELERAGGSEVLLDRDLTGEVVAARIVRALDDHARLKRMSDAARAWSMPDAAARIASLIGEVAPR
ncbi:MAG: UDP-N-acetylglucosamine--N-acetylmuramyl-(pentapeptide) pyrophosphoryl-undecaprenol N-acetylglucosamine transferase, partial [Actinomycetota bacterium]